MKSTFLLFFAIFLLGSCKPVSLNENDRNPRLTDLARGKNNFSLQNLKDISGKEIAKKVSEDCTKYKNSNSFSILGDLSPFKKLQNCLAKAIDEGLKPLCEQEEQAKELKKYYEDRRDREAVKEVEEYLVDLEEIKYDTAEEIYIMSDEFYSQCEELKESLDKGIDRREHKKQNFGNSVLDFLSRMGNVAVSSECNGFTRLLDSKARTACKTFDFSKINRRKR